MRRTLMASALALLLGAPASFAQRQQAGAAPVSESEALAKKLANPIADLTVVPFEGNWEQPVGPNDQSRFILNVQPSVPFPLTRDWNLIQRVIMPIMSQPPLTPDGAPAFGIGDLLASTFFSPARLKRAMWGVGPAISVPSTAQPTLGTEKWCIGPTLVILRQSGAFTMGVLWNQLWSFAGNAKRDDVNKMYIQPFFAHVGKGAVTFRISSETTIDWRADGGRWTAPIIFAVSKLSSFGTFPASYQIGVGVFVAKPENGPAWKLRASLTLIMPRRK